MRILITGGVGYVGGRLVQHLLAQPDPPEVRLTTRRGSDGIPVWSKGLEVVRADMTDTEALRRAVRDVDTVVHLATANEVDSARDPEEAVRVTGLGAYRLLQACQAASVRRLVHLSTYHVYGANLRGLVTEATVPRPIHPYAVAHRLAEDMVTWHRDVRGQRAVILRVSNGFGCPADAGVNRWSLVFNDLCRQAVRDGELVLRSSGRQRRDFVSLHDVCRAVHHVLGLDDARWGDGLFNLGAGLSLSILEVAERIARVYEATFGRTIGIKAGADEENAVPSAFTYSAARLLATGFALTDSMDDEIRRTLELCAAS